MTAINTAAHLKWIAATRKHLALVVSSISTLIAVIMCLSRQEVLSYRTHSPVKKDKSLEDVLGNLNLNSTITPQMNNLGLSQEGEWKMT